ncbi:malonyl-CoA decarboxylase [Zeimonas arvi]|uniref:MCD, Malonyl-CoA decarboxylase MCD n=1 Tax=Zeimonas arvi TaxID=2498847 RepID=A0A5C8P5P8_9BURK|nr:malonyl-CoA decarboxylase [Zeimonas arvi]TXL68623.1 MCD, Malonyl-CoA decarboxylase MCD [Zeimonas arvi]
MPGSLKANGAVGRLAETVAYGPEIFARFVRALKGRNKVDAPVRLAEMAAGLLSIRGEASGVALARQLLDEYLEASDADKLAFLLELAREFGPDQKALERSVAAWMKKPSGATALALHQAAESRRQELIRRMNQAPGGTATLVSMREDVLRNLKAEPDLAPLDADFVHLLSSWFNRGFLRMHRIDWSTPAEILERIIRYEAVHEISSWDDLRRRIDPSDRQCFGFFHPALGNDPLVFVEVALTEGIPSAIAPLLAEKRKPIDPSKADTAVFYSISNCHMGLRGVSFGNFLIKQVVEELSREFAGLQTFATLSPVPGFTRWLAKEAASRDGALLTPGDRDRLEPLTRSDVELSDRLLEAAKPALNNALLTYLFDAKDGTAKSLDPVSRFHLGNGARLDRVHWAADTSSKGLKQALGFMVSYVYELQAVERNHEAYVSKGEIAMSPALSRSVAAMRKRREQKE